MSKTLFMMIHEIYTQIDKPFYDELTDYERGIKDILNLLDVRMSGNNVEEMFDYIMTTIKNNHEFSYDYYYQIDYIDNDGLASYIKSYSNDDREKALRDVHLLNLSNDCIHNDNTKYVLDMYRLKRDKDGFSIDGTDELIKQNINEELE